MKTTRRDAAFEVPGMRGIDGPVSVAAWVFTPDPGPARAVLFAVPGGSYAKDYWHIEIAGHPGYSFADFMTARGYAVVAVDKRRHRRQHSATQR